MRRLLRWLKVEPAHWHPRVMLGRMPAAWAIARQTLTESIRSKMFLVLVGFVLALVAMAFYLPVIEEGEDRLKLVQSFGFGGTMFFGTLIAVFLAATVVPEDIAERRVFSVLATPIGRAHYLLGRLMGVGLVLGSLVFGVWLISVLALPLFLGDLGEGESDRLLVARRRVLPAGIDRFPAALDGQERKIRPGLLTDGPVRLETGKPVSFIFTGLLRDQLPAGPLAGELAMITEQVDRNEFYRVYKVSMRFVNPTTGEAGRAIERFGHIGKSLKFEGPAEMVDDSGQLEVQLFTNDRRFRFDASRASLKVFGERENYAWNFAKGFAMVYLQLLLVAALALSCSTFMTSPVAIVTSLFLYILGNLLDVLRSFAETLDKQATSIGDILRFDYGGGSAAGHHDAKPVNAVSETSDAVLFVKARVLEFCDLYPDFSRFDMTSYLVNRFSIPGEVLLSGFAYALAYGLVFTIVGNLVFHFRQVDR